MSTIFGLMLALLYMLIVLYKVDKKNQELEDRIDEIAKVLVKQGELLIYIEGWLTDRFGKNGDCKLSKRFNTYRQCEFCNRKLENIELDSCPHCGAPINRG